VQRPEDLAEARRLIGGKAALLAKIEKPAAIERLEEIVEMCDGVMVARGDLGVELPPQSVPPLQKRIVEVSRRMGRPVVVATQMLESMIKSPSPTRA
ncbi:pyruvate kinase, partial [Pandoraea pneumonica]